MDDVIFLAVAVIFFAVALAYVVACARLGGSEQGGWNSPASGEELRTINRCKPGG